MSGAGDVWKEEEGFGQDFVVVPPTIEGQNFFLLVREGNRFPMGVLLIDSESFPADNDTINDK